MASRLAAAKAGSSSPTPLARLVSRRGLCDYSPRPYDPHKVNLWEDPWSPMRWKQSHFVVATIAVWGVSVYVGLALFGGDEENKKKVESARTKAK